MSLTNLLKGSSSTAATADQSTDPVVDTTADDFAPPDTFVPCGKQESCGEAKNFKSEKEFQDFPQEFVLFTLAEIPKQKLPRKSTELKILWEPFVLLNLMEF